MIPNRRSSQDALVRRLGLGRGGEGGRFPGWRCRASNLRRWASMTSNASIVALLVAMLAAAAATDLAKSDNLRVIAGASASASAIALAGIWASGSLNAQQPGFKRVELQRHDLAVPGREVVQVRAEFD